jgi:outer membrane lipoprotein-sorting protein
MKNLYIFVFIFLFTTNSTATIKENIIQNLKNIYNISFNFEQNINGKIENGKCVILYPKKINCIYDSTNKKILVSNGKSLVIKTKNSYYRYSLKKTSLNLILNKEFLLKKIRATNGREIDNKFINYKFQEEENEINIFFDKKNFNLIGWQTLDIYQNLSITYLNSIIKNQKLNKKLFILPEQN